MRGAAVTKQRVDIEGAMPVPRPVGQRPAVLGLRLLPDATAPISQITAFELFQRRNDAADGAAVDAEICRRCRLDPVPGSAGYWAAVKDAYALIRGLEAAEASVVRADHDFAYTFCDGERNRFDGSYAEFKAARLDRCVEAHERLAALRDFAAGFPLVGKLLAAKAQEQRWRGL